MRFDILTIFPSLFASHLDEGIMRRAREQRYIKVNLINIRDFATDKHSMTDDRPFGGGEGMVMKPEPLTAALHSVKGVSHSPKVVLLSPQGEKFDHAVAERLACDDQLILVCGRYEGVDERFRRKYVTHEISIGDYVLTGGELAAMVMIDAITRLLPGVLGCQASAENDTFSKNLLKHPQYTRPRVFEGEEVPEILLSGDHRLIEEYRFIESVTRTAERRPELLQRQRFSKKEIQLLKKHNIWKRLIKDHKGTEK